MENRPVVSIDRPVLYELFSGLDQADLLPEALFNIVLQYTFRKFPVDLNGTLLSKLLQKVAWVDDIYSTIKRECGCSLSKA